MTGTTATNPTKEVTMTQHTVSITATEATETAISGHSMVCTCGLRFGTSLSRPIAESDANKHLAWHEAEGR